MILAHGIVYGNEHLPSILNNLERDCFSTIQNSSLPPEIVINACDVLATNLELGKFDFILNVILSNSMISKEKMHLMIQSFKKEALHYKILMELGTDLSERPRVTQTIKRKRYPLGILFHIAAGNVDGLPAYSVMEGLLAGNINLLKLPSNDHGFSLALLKELVTIEPLLKDYIYIFDLPSTDVNSLKFLANISDAVVVWGGDQAISFARQMVSPSTKIISYGHKLSFAYCTNQSSKSDLVNLAHHICETNQLLCSSCQGIYYDCESQEDQVSFSHRFFEIFKEVALQYPPVAVGMLAKNALHLYNEELESFYTKNLVIKENGLSVLVSEDKELSLSYMFRNIWIKRLKKDEIFSVLKHQKGYLQTVGLLCNDDERVELNEIFAKVGAVRITTSNDLSRMIPGEAHDGDYPLQMYTRIVEMNEK